MALPANTLNALADMLRQPQEDEDSDIDLDDKPVSGFAKMGPGQLGPQKKGNESKETAGNTKKNTKNIWTEEEVGEGAEYETMYDPRPQPEYEIIYKQSVSSEDIYLGMGNKTPTTASCEDMVVKIKLPATKSADVTLDVKSKFLDCRTPKYKLGLHLPHPVDHKSGKAQWDGNKQELCVTLRMSRDLDFMNF